MELTKKDRIMYTTEFKHGEGGVEEITHDFGYGVRIVTNLKDHMIRRMHGDIAVKEWPADMSVAEYHRLLMNIESESEMRSA